MRSIIASSATAWPKAFAHHPGVPNPVVQVLPSWDEWAQEVSDSRIYGGVHYRFSNEAGEQIGRRAARMALDKALQPLPGKKRRR